MGLYCGLLSYTVGNDSKGYSYYYDNLGRLTTVYPTQLSGGTLYNEYGSENAQYTYTQDELSVIEASPMALTDKNLYAYCDNNPVTRVDADGEFSNIVIGAVVGVGVCIGVPLAYGIEKSMNALSGWLSGGGWYSQQERRIQFAK